MVERLEQTIDDLSGRFEPPTEFVVPGETVVAAWLDFARTVARRAERLCLAGGRAPPSLAGVYLNRLSDLLWTMARWQEGESRTDPTSRHQPGRGASHDPDHRGG